MQFITEILTTYLNIYSFLWILNKFLITKAKYKLIEPYYMDDSTPNRPVVFSGSLYSNNDIIINKNTTK
jgi:hypothetical protein